LIRERKGFQLHPEYDTDPSVYFIDGKIGQSPPTETARETAREPEPVGGIK
jgi:hypothetical protein